MTDESTRVGGESRAIVTFPGEKVAEIVVYPTDEDALETAGNPDAAL